MKKFIILIIMVIVCSNAYALTIAEQLTAINDARLDIKTSIVEKGVAVPTDTPLADYAGKIDLIPAGSTGLSVNNYQVMIEDGASATESITDGDLVIVTSQLAIKDTETQPTIQNTEGVAMSSDGEYLVIIGDDASTVVESFKWNSGNNKYEATTAIDTAPGGGCYSVAMSDDGQYLALGFITTPCLYTYKWSSGNNRYEKTADPDVAASTGAFDLAMACTMTSDGSRLTVSSMQTPYFKTYTWVSGNNRYEVNNAPDTALPDSGTSGMTCSSDGEYLAISGSGSPYCYTYVWSTGNARYEATVAMDTSPGNPISHQNGISMSDDGLHLAVSAYAIGVMTYSWSSGNSRYEKDTNPSPQYYVNNSVTTKLSSDGLSLIVTTLSDNVIAPTFYIWNATDSQYITTNFSDTELPANSFIKSTAINNTKDRLVALVELDNVETLYTYTIPDVITFKASVLDNTTSYTIPTSNDRYNWALIGTAQNSGISGDDIGINSFFYFTDEVEAFLTTP